MKNSKVLATRMLAVAMFTTSMSGCVNEIQDKTTKLSPGDIPIKISTNILCTQSRAIGSQFEENDAIGFYALAESQELNQSRYIDNMCFTCTSEGLVPDKEVFYPSGDNKCDFISYYPYQVKAIPSNESNMIVTIRANQSAPSEYSTSDFMIAKTMGVSPSSNNVKLDFEHKFSQLNITLQLTNNENIKELKKTTTVSISAYTKTTYDFKTEAFSSFSTLQEIIPNGEWEINESTRKLTGKKALIIPQDITKIKIYVHINGRTYSSILPDGLLLESNTSSEIILHVDSKLGISKLEPQICDWKEGNSKDATLEEEEKNNFIRLSELNFDQTGVHEIITESNIVIAEVCKEYLKSSNIDAQAIVLYPTTTKNQGTVLQLLNTSENVHGGSIVWDTDSNSFSYTPGSSAPIATLYANTENIISFDEPTNPQAINVTGRELKDTRELELISYPIIKIGTQYWMGENLHTTMYNNGKPITEIKDMSKTEAGYFSNEGNLFYNPAAVIKGTLAPKGWKIPNSTEWEKLQKYIGNITTTLKAGTQWADSEGISKANNKTGFNAQPIGFFNKRSSTNSMLSGYAYKTQYASYWCMGSSQTSIAENGVGIKYNSDTFAQPNYTDHSGYSIRCIKE